MTQGQGGTLHLNVNGVLFEAAPAKQHTGYNKYKKSEFRSLVLL